MALDRLAEYQKRLLHLEQSAYIADQAEEMAAFCTEMAGRFPTQLPVWMEKAQRRRFDDVEEMLSALPDIVAQWYNIDNIPVYVLSSDAVMERNIRQAATRQTPSLLPDFEVIYVRADGSIATEASFDRVLLLCPGRFQSRQLAEITKRLAVGGAVCLLEPEGVDDYRSRIWENDKKQMAFLYARWEIETEPETKKARLRELMAHYRAMIGGAGDVRKQH